MPIKRLIDYIMEGGIKNKRFIAPKKPENIIYRIDYILNGKLHVTEYDSGKFRQTKYNLITHLKDIESVGSSFNNKDDEQTLL